MKYSSGLLVATAALAFAQPRVHGHNHGHQHLHNHKARDVQQVYEKITVTVYELNGKIIPEDQVQQGIANGTLIWGDDEGEIQEAPSPVPVSIQTPEVKAVEVPSAPAPEPTPEPAPAPVESSYSPPSYSGGGDFPDYDDSLDCGTFPSAFGALEVDYLGLGKWIGIQAPRYSGSDGFDDIKTYERNNCNGADCCKEGAFCSYACPAGYQKTQWPALQGRTKQSIGGLLCKDGKLTLTRGDVTKKLCEKGNDAVTIQVKNTMGKGASICRTDYPGTESETVPVWVGAGGQSELACPDGDKYYKWDGLPTSAQYYVNPAGVQLEDACTWGDGSKPTGNWAPANLGVGYSGGMGWISIFQNAPTTQEKLDFSIEIKGDDIIGDCKYDAGKQAYCSSITGCNGQGCTVTVKSGTAWFEFS